MRFLVANPRQGFYARRTPKAVEGTRSEEFSSSVRFEIAGRFQEGFDFSQGARAHAITRTSAEM